MCDRCETGHLQARESVLTCSRGCEDAEHTVSPKHLVKWIRKSIMMGVEHQRNSDSACSCMVSLK